MEKRSKSFVMTGYVQRGTCNCGCVTSNTFWQDGGFSGSSHLASLHSDIEKYLDELSGAGPKGQGDSCDVKVTVTIETLGEHDHRLLNRHSFSGLGMEDNFELKKQILEPSPAESPQQLRGADEFGTKTERKKRVDDLSRELPRDFLKDIHDRLLLVKRSGDLSKLNDLMESLQDVIAKKDSKCISSKWR